MIASKQRTGQQRAQRAKGWRRAATATMVVFAALATLMGGQVMANQGAANQPGRPLPVTEVEQFGCDVDSCSLRWTPVNNLSTLRAWDVHVNDQYRTWVPIPNGPALEYGPGASDPRLRDVVIGDVIRIVPVRFGGAFAPLEETTDFFVRDHGPDYGPGLEVRPANFGVTGVGDTSAEIELSLHAIYDASYGWGGPDAVVTGVEIVGADRAAFQVERLVDGQLSCLPENCPRDEVQPPFTVFVADQYGYGHAAVVTFSPTRAGLHQASLVVSHNGRTGTVAMPLRGTGEDGASFGPGVVVNDTDFGAVAVGDDFIDVEISIYALPEGDDPNSTAIVTDVSIVSDQPEVFEIIGLVQGQLSCPVENPDCPRTPIAPPFEVSLSDQYGFGRAVVVRFSPRDIGPTGAKLMVAHDGVDGTTEVNLTGVGS